MDADSYTTELNGQKFKVAHNRAGSNKWQPTENGQRKKLIGFLEKVI